jgi:hypothetical protein
MPVLIIPVWAWINAVVLIAAGAFVWGKLSGEAMPKRDKTLQSTSASSPPEKA